MTDSSKRALSHSRSLMLPPAATPQQRSRGISPLKSAQNRTRMSSTRSLLSRQRQSFPVSLGRRRVNIKRACDFSSRLPTVRAFLQRLLDILFLSRPISSRHGRVIQPDACPPVLAFSSRQVGSGTTGEATRGAAERLTDVPLALLCEPEEDCGGDWGAC